MLKLQFDRLRYSPSNRRWVTWKIFSLIFSKCSGHFLVLVPDIIAIFLIMLFYLFIASLPTSFIVIRVIIFFSFIMMTLAYVFSIVLLDMKVVEKLITLTKLQYARFYLQLFGWNNTYCKRHEKKDILNLASFIFI